MSKVVMSLPKGVLKRCAIGGLIALAVYVLLQFLWALLVDRGVLTLEGLYPFVCVSAALASFLGCGYSVLGGKENAVLTVPAVVIVFLLLTVATALLTTDTAAMGNGLIGVGLSMAAGGLLAAILGGGLSGRLGGGRSRRKRHKHSRR